jgi:hypothetical protein
MCTSVLSKCVSGAYGDQKNDIKTSRTGDMYGCDRSCGCWDPNLGPPKEQVLLMAKPFLHSHSRLFWMSIPLENMYCDLIFFYMYVSR